MLRRASLGIGFDLQGVLRLLAGREPAGGHQQQEKRARELPKVRSHRYLPFARRK